MKVVLDTNVLYQALRAKKGASRAILELVFDQKIKLGLSIPVFKEYEEVLNRRTSKADLGINDKEIKKILGFIAYASYPQTIYFAFRPNLRDEDDNHFVELAIACNADYLITSNVKDYLIDNDLKFQDLKVITPSNFMNYWRENYENKS
ncbi:MULTISPECIES: putative toxin-antitoxin system toxin component, PIN family [Leptospira]|uniref:putative toxin-antitoxin system toxin component, PIN family n=1 Tax=Leptospira TaxID=171 RepID=UPI001EE89712|nr:MULTISPECIES: putative toxin-antitoxin system toxin component, PIN family [Leptospira]MCG6162037.1 putative toxin-antitoxin system toxin component, PIN family [Leptospira bandrabouensis]MCG6170102.1 putative toxin-antitoxin system toxin component, PIN family [Leptospira sanjuanensis]MCG6195441.1 putative toxin-antitoxin system toxin component, PIN family [Leptospira sanjuanensis]